MEAVMNFLDSVVGSVNTLLWDNLLMYLLVATGIYFTFRLRFIQVRKFGEGMKALFGNFSLNGGSNGAGLSSFQQQLPLRPEDRERFSGCGFPHFSEWRPFTQKQFWRSIRKRW